LEEGRDVGGGWAVEALSDVCDDAEEEEEEDEELGLFR
jgi:hypothetical protein